MWFIVYALLYRVPIPSSYNSISPAEQRKEMTQRSNKMRSFYGQRKHLAGESSLEYLNKMENEEFLEDLRGEDKAKLEEKRERINAKIEASMQEKRIILAAVQAVTRLRQLKEKKRLLRKARWRGRGRWWWGGVLRRYCEWRCPCRSRTAQIYWKNHW